RKQDHSSQHRGRGDPSPDGEPADGRSEMLAERVVTVGSDVGRGNEGPKEQQAERKRLREHGRGGHPLERRQAEDADRHHHRARGRGRERGSGSTAKEERRGAQQQELSGERRGHYLSTGEIERVEASDSAK